MCNCVSTVYVMALNFISLYPLIHLYLGNLFILENKKGIPLIKKASTKPYRDGNNNYFTLVSTASTRSSYYESPEVQDVIYDLFLDYTITAKQRKKMGFPMTVPGKPGVFIKKHAFKWEKVSKESTSILDEFKKKCVRCGEPFFSTSEGKYFFREECVYHWGRLELAVDYEPYLTCCKDFPTSEGCTKCKAHVWSGTHGGVNGPLLGFVQTKPSTTGCRQVFALDCELVFTTMGLEVARVSLVNVDGSSQYDALVQPEHEIIDFNTRFSGVTKEDYVVYKAKTLRQAQYDLLHYIKSDTILVGHGIENDLRALKIVHTLVVDTTAIFPHEHGLPCRRSLKSLAQEYLGKNIQSSATGHDSLEDARVALRLVLKRIRMDRDASDPPKQPAGKSSSKL